MSKTMRVRITFLEEVLGTANADKDVHSEFIASKAPDAPSREEEVASLGVDEVERKEMTIFPRLEDGTPFLWDYQIRGFFKSAAQAMSYIGGKSKLSAYKKKIDLLVHIQERKIPLIIPNGMEMGNCQRPLRASTMQGDRVALANSETCPAGTIAEFTIECLQDDLMKYVIEWLDYGKYNGLGQWRNSRKGSFEWTEITNK